jgi:hypothetical protein
MDHGTTTTPFDMVVLNEMSRFHLALDALKHTRQGTSYAVGKGDVWLLPAEGGECAFQPSGEVTLLEIAIP